MPFPPPELRPMLPSRAAEPFDSEDHVFELRWAGVRALAFIESARLRLVSQSGRDITAWFPELAGIAAQVKDSGAVLDGEIVALDDDGAPDMALVSPRLLGAPNGQDGVPCLFQAYDALYAGGQSVLERPLLQRKEALARLLRDPGPAVPTEFVPDEGIAFFEAARERRLAGVVARAKASRYHPGRVTRDWLEIPVYELDNFVIGGYVLGVGREEPVAGILIGEPAASGRLRFVGQVQGNLPGATIEGVLAPYTAPACPFTTAPSLARLVYWLRPALVCQVKYARREPDGGLRFPIFVTMRPDLSAGDLVTPGTTESRAPTR